MSLDLLEDVPVVVPIYDVFDRTLPEKLERPERLLEELLSALDGQIHELEQAGSKPGADDTTKKAAKFRKDFIALEKRALKEMETSAKKDEATKKLAKITGEVLESNEEVTAELEVPVRETNMRKALGTLKGRNNPPQGKIAGFEKQAKEIAKEQDPKKR